MNFIVNKLLEEETNKYDRIGLIAGEIFNNELKTKEEKDLFYKLIDILIDKIHSKKVLQVLITTSMIYKNLDNFLEFCKYLNDNNVLDKFLICTSYDIIGRFTDNTKEIWNNNMKQIQLLYPNIKLHVEMILTQAFIESVLNNSFDIKAFNINYNCTTDYIVPFTGYGKLYKNKYELEEKLSLNFYIMFIIKVYLQNNI